VERLGADVAKRSVTGGKRAATTRFGTTHDVPGKLIARVGLATNKPAEFIILRISQDTRALEAELAAAGA
jgi:phage tail sheath protein FI